jgi:hypothetical protein
MSLIKHSPAPQEPRDPHKSMPTYRIFSRIAKLTILIIIAAAIFILGANAYRYLSEKRMRQEMRAVILNGSVSVDQEVHDWNVTTGPIEKPVKIDLYLRNKSSGEVSGTLVFSVDLDSKGIEENFIKQMIEVFGTNFGDNRKFRAINAYIKRGQKLKPGTKYEPIEKDPKNDYAFDFRRFIILKPGEIQHITHEQDIPPAYRGSLLTVRISSIEFDGSF